MTEKDWGKASASQSEKRFLAGPSSRWAELSQAIRICLECIKGFRAFHFLAPSVTVFGSARFKEQHKYYQLAQNIGEQLAREGFTVMTGGGPGIMEAANRGAKKAAGYSVGSNIKLPHEQTPNPYLDRWVEFDYFFVRKLMLIKYSYAFIALPGGYGTLDEIFETTTLIQTGKICNFPLILVGSEFWSPLLSFIQERLLREGTIKKSEFDLITVTDSPEQAVQIILSVGRQFLGPKWPRQKLKASWWLAER